MLPKEQYYLNDAEVKSLLGNTLYQLGLPYYTGGKILERTFDGHTLSATVEEFDRLRPNLVEIDLEDNQFIGDCDCGESWDKFCRHMAGVLIAWAREPGSFQSLDLEGPAIPAPRRNGDARDPGEAARSILARLLRGLDTRTPAIPGQVTQLPGLATPERVQDELKQLLENVTVQELRTMAKARDIKLKGSAKAEIVRQMVEHLSNPDQIGQMLARLAPAEQVSLQLADLLTQPGQGITPDEVTAVEKALGTTTASGQDGLKGLVRLSELGLVIPQRTYSGIRYVVPLAVRPHLPPLTTILSPYPGTVETLRVSAHDPLTLPHHLYLAWQHLRTHQVLRPKPQVNLTGYGQHLLQGWDFIPAEVQALQQKPNWMYGQNTALTVPSISAVRLEETAARDLKNLLGSDDDRLDFILGLLADLGMIRVKGRQVMADAELMPALLQLPTAERLRALVDIWLYGTQWSEMDLTLRRAGRLRLRRSISYGYINIQPEQLRVELAQGRQFLVRLLRQAEVGRWYSYVAFARAVFRLRPDFLYRPTGAPASYVVPRIWWLESEITGKPFDLRNESEWQQSAGQFVQQVFVGPLAWLGIVELGYDAAGLAAFRLTDLGAFLLGRPGAPALAETFRPIVLGDDLTATAWLGQTDVRAYDVLGRLGDLVESNARFFRYKLTADHARRAFEDGLLVAEILADLERFAAGRVPQAIQEALQDWWSRYALVRIYPDLTVIECTDDYTLPELLAVTTLGRHLIYQLSPRLAVIDPNAVDAVMYELIAKGYTPKLVEG